MTEQFEKWYESNCPDINVNDDEVHAWLTAFVKDCYKDAILLCSREHVSGQVPTEPPCHTHFMIVFERKLRDFGLKSKP